MVFSSVDYWPVAISSSHSSSLVVMAYRQKTLERPTSERRFSNNRHGTVFTPDFNLDLLAGDEGAASARRKGKSSSRTTASPQPRRPSAMDDIAVRPRNKTIDEIVAQLSPSLVDTREMMPYFIANNSTTAVGELNSPTLSELPLVDTDSVAPTDSTLSLSRPYAMRDRRLLKKQVRTVPRKRQREETERLALAVCCCVTPLHNFPHVVVTRDKKPFL